MTKESQSFEMKHSDVQVLSKNVMQYLGKDAQAAKQEIDENVAALSQRYSM